MKKTLREFIEECLKRGINMDDKISIKSWAEDYEITFDNGITVDSVYIDKDKISNWEK